MDLPQQGHAKLPMPFSDGKTETVRLLILRRRLPSVMRTDTVHLTVTALQEHAASSNVCDACRTSGDMLVEELQHSKSSWLCSA